MNLFVKGHYYLYCFIFILLVGATACSEGSDCYSENTSTISLSFFKRNTLNPDTSFYERDTLVVSRVYTVDNPDSLIMANDTIFGTLVLPVNPQNNTTAYRIGRHNLTVRYDIQQRIMSPDCGVEQIFSNLDTVTYSFDSLVIKSRNLDRNEVNFEIYTF